MSHSSYHHKKNKNLLHARPSSRITLTYKRLMVITVETKLKMSWRVVPDTDYKQVVVWYGGLKAGNDVNGLTSLCKPLATCCRALILGNTCSMCRNLPWSLAAETTRETESQYAFANIVWLGWQFQRVSTCFKQFMETRLFGPRQLWFVLSLKYKMEVRIVTMHAHMGDCRRQNETL